MKKKYISLGTRKTTGQLRALLEDPGFLSTPTQIVANQHPLPVSKVMLVHGARYAHKQNTYTQ